MSLVAHPLIFAAFFGALGSLGGMSALALISYLDRRDDRRAAIQRRLKGGD